MTAGQLWTLALLGFFHGIDPGMGWLFAVSYGLQERSRKSLLRVLPFVALGHEGAIAVMVVILTVSSSLLAAKVVVLAGGGLLMLYGLWLLLRRRHLKWVGMRLSSWQLAMWAFVMSSVHGAGLMLVAVFAWGPDEKVSALDLRNGVGQVLVNGAAAMAVHVGVMIVTTGLVALLVYEVLGLRILRSMWVNLDRVWAFALIGAGVATLISA
ncbi:MAG: hypothetical protein J2P25_03945 [Nocardiopsaceae bacterium]|nr:hypothetical protein [Nocardiopsaceae bacterium]